MTIPTWLNLDSSVFTRKLGLELTDITPTRATGRCPVEGNTQVFGQWHGGATCAVAETLASVAALAEVGPQGQVVGLELNASHLRAATDGWVTGTATAVRIGGRVAVYDVRLTHDGDVGDDALIAVARVTVMLRRARNTENV